MDSVPLLDLKAQFDSIRDEVDAAMRRVVETQGFVLGPEVEALEREIAGYVGSRHAVGCASGTDALILALAALDVGPGRRVLTTPFSFFSTASCAYKVGARPAFADIDAETFNLDPDAAAAVLDADDGSIAALLPVHLFGQCADMDAFRRLGERHGIPVIEDAAQALGASYRPEDSATATHAGALGSVGCYSFFPTKNLGAVGDGGMMVTDDDAVAERLRLLRVHGGRQMYHHQYVGWNSRLDALQAAVLRVKLPRLDGWCEARRANADRYDGMLADAGVVSRGAVRLPARASRCHHIFNQYTLRVERRDALREHLTAHRIGHSVYYPVALHRQECFAELGYGEGRFPVAETACREVVALPVFPEMTERQQARVVDAIRSFYD